MSNLGKTYQLVIKRILRYLKGTMNNVLLFEKNSCDIPIINGYTNSNFVGDNDNRKSFSSYIFTVFENIVS